MIAQDFVYNKVSYIYLRVRFQIKTKLFQLSNGKMNKNINIFTYNIFQQQQVNAFITFSCVHKMLNLIGWLEVTN